MLGHLGRVHTTLHAGVDATLHATDHGTPSHGAPSHGASHGTHGAAWAHAAAHLKEKALLVSTHTHAPNKHIDEAHTHTLSIYLYVHLDIYL